MYENIEKKNTNTFVYRFGRIVGINNVYKAGGKEVPVHGDTFFEERLVDGEIASYQWILTGSMWADALMKEMEMHHDMRELLTYGNI